MTTAAELDSVLRDLLGAAAPEVDLDTVDPRADLREALDIDSFAFLQFVVGLRDRLGVEVPESDYGQIRSLEACRRYLASRLVRSR
jgi:acyl carrier protein